MTLSEALVALRDPRSPERTAAMRVVIGWCEKHAARLLAGVYGDDMLHSDMVEEAVAHLEIAAVRQSPTSGFRGRHEGEAVNWCKTILIRQAASWWRKHGPDYVARKRRADRPDSDGRVVALRSRGTSGGGGRDAAGSVDHDSLDQAQFELIRCVELIVDVIERLHRGRLRTAVERIALLCAVEYRAGLADIEAGQVKRPVVDVQIDRWGFAGRHAGGPRTPAARLKARDRVFQYRKRGGDDIPFMLRLAVDRELLDADSAAHLADLLRAPWPPPEDGASRQVRVRLRPDPASGRRKAGTTPRPVSSPDSENDGGGAA